MDLDPRIGLGLLLLLGGFCLYQGFRDYSAQAETVKSGAWRLEIIAGLLLLGAAAYIVFQDHLGPETIPWFYDFIDTFYEIGHKR